MKIDTGNIITNHAVKTSEPMLKHTLHVVKSDYIKPKNRLNRPEFPNKTRSIIKFCKKYTFNLPSPLNRTHRVYNIYVECREKGLTLPFIFNTQRNVF